MKKKITKKPRKKTKRRLKLFTRAELALKLDVSQSAITKWEQAGLPVAAPGRRGTPSLFLLAHVQKWREQRDLKARENGAVDLVRERARKERAQALVAEQTVELRAGELVRAADLDQVLCAQNAAVRSKILAWPAMLSAQVHRAGELKGVSGVEKVLVTAAEDILLELSSGLGCSCKAPCLVHGASSKNAVRKKKATSSRKKTVRKRRGSA